MAQLDLDQHGQPPSQPRCRLIEAFGQRKRIERVDRRKQLRRARRLVRLQVADQVEFRPGRARRPESNALLLNSCTRFSPQTGTPNASAARIADAGCIFETAMREISVRYRPASRQANAIPASMRSKISPSMAKLPPAASLNRPFSMAVFFKVFFHFQGCHPPSLLAAMARQLPAMFHLQNPGKRG